MITAYLQSGRIIWSYDPPENNIIGSRLYDLVWEEVWDAWEDGHMLCTANCYWMILK